MMHALLYPLVLAPLPVTAGWLARPARDYLRACRKPEYEDPIT